MYILVIQVRTIGSSMQVSEGYHSKKWLFVCCWLVWHENGCR